MNKRFLDVLENCLQRMEEGEPMNSILATHPDLEAQLRPLLETAVRARFNCQEDLSMAELERHRSQFLNLAADLRQGRDNRLMTRRFWRPAVTIISVVAILVMSCNSLLVASAHSVPGDTLYPLKRTVESTQLNLVFNPAKKQELENTFSQRRVDETRSLITHQRIESVDFTGVVSNQSESEWLVSGIPVVITSHTKMDTDIEVGDEVEVLGSTNAEGDVDATRLTLIKNTLPDENLPGENPTMTPYPDDGQTEESPARTILPDENHQQETPTHVSSTDEYHAEDTRVQTQSPGENHPQDSPTPTPYLDGLGESGER